MPDYEDEADGRLIASRCADWPLLGGGSGLLEHLARELAALGREHAGRLIEDTLADLALLAHRSGTMRIISAGGETSGAVTMRLGWQAYRVGTSLAPGVPVLIPLEDLGSRLILKSGNFGSERFFLKAREVLT